MSYQPLVCQECISSKTFLVLNFYITNQTSVSSSFCFGFYYNLLLNSFTTCNLLDIWYLIDSVNWNYVGFYGLQTTDLAYWRSYINIISESTELLLNFFSFCLKRNQTNQALLDGHLYSCPYYNWLLLCILIQNWI